MQLGWFRFAHDIFRTNMGNFLKLLTTFIVIFWDIEKTCMRLSPCEGEMDKGIVGAELTFDSQILNNFQLLLRQAVGYR